MLINICNETSYSLISCKMEEKGKSEYNNGIIIIIYDHTQFDVVILRAETAS